MKTGDYVQVQDVPEQSPLWQTNLQSEGGGYAAPGTGRTEFGPQKSMEMLIAFLGYSLDQISSFENT